MVSCCNLCRKPQIIKNKYVSNLIGTIWIYFAVAYILPIGNFSVYITSYISLEQDFVTMHYGYFFSLIMTFAMTFSRAIGGYLENKIGFMGTTQFGLLICLITNVFFFRAQNIWIVYILIVFLGLGAGIATSLIAKNLTLFNPKKKGSISGIIGILTIVLSALFAFAGEKMINPSGEYVNEKLVYSEEVSKRTYIYYVSGFIATPVGGFFGFLFLNEYKKEDDPTNYLKDANNNTNKLKELYDVEDTSPNPEEELVADLNIKAAEQKEKEKAEKNFEREVDNLRQKRHIRKVIKSWRFWRISIASLLLNFSVMFMVNTGRIFGALINISPIVLQLMAIFQAIGMIIIGPILGCISDRKSPLALLRIVSLICVIPGILLNILLENSLIFLLSIILYLFGLIGNMVGAQPLIMEIYGIQESVILGGFMSSFAKISEIITTCVAFGVSFIYTGANIRIPYKIIYVLSSLFSYFSFYLMVVEDIDKYKYDDSDVEISPIEMSRESILSNL